MACNQGNSCHLVASHDSGHQLFVASLLHRVLVCGSFSVVCCRLLRARAAKGSPVSRGISHARHPPVAGHRTTTRDVPEEILQQERSTARSFTGRAESAKLLLAVCSVACQGHSSPLAERCTRDIMGARTLLSVSRQCSRCQMLRQERKGSGLWIRTKRFSPSGGKPP